MVLLTRYKSSQKAPHTVGYNYVKIFHTPGCGNTSRDYSRQYEPLRAAALTDPLGASTFDSKIFGGVAGVSGAGYSGAYAW